MTPSSTTGLDDRLASALCYSAWWMTGILFLVLERQHRGVRFHAAQSLVLFGSLSLVLVALGVFSALAMVVSSQAHQVARALADAVWVGAAVLWVVLVVRAWRGETWRVPLAATLADGIASKTSW
ncbi:MAG: DUF4870 domain-containing protein [Acidobacteria bacterium]|nr:DUF4870 domain-containing protein [Acidobacteriota bacterium]